MGLFGEISTATDPESQLDTFLINSNTVSIEQTIKHINRSTVKVEQTLKALCRLKYAML